MDRLDQALLLCGCATLLLCSMSLINIKKEETERLEMRKKLREGRPILKKRPWSSPLGLVPPKKKKKKKGRPDITPGPPKKRRVWVRDLSLREQHASVYELLQEEGEQSLKNIIRMNTEVFDELLGYVRPLIERQNTTMRMAITAEERLALTLRYLATGDSYPSLAYFTGISTAAISRIIPETCKAIHTVLKRTFLKFPSSTEDWEKVAEDFYQKWNLPNCIGVLGGKHVKIKTPNTATHAFSKSEACVSLLAIVDADYNFIFAHVDDTGSLADSGIFNRSELKQSIENKTLSIPEARALPATGGVMPFYLIADIIFPLKTYLMKPVNVTKTTGPEEEKIYNYRVNRAVWVLQNAFGVLASAFAIYSKPISLRSSVAQDIVLATICLHNFQRSKNLQHYTPDGTIDKEDTTFGGIIPGSWRSDVNTQGWEEFIHQGSNNSNARAKEMRMKLCDYVNSEQGSLPWQRTLIDQ